METHDVIVGQRAEIVGGNDDAVVLVGDSSTSNADEFIDDSDVGDSRDVGEATGLTGEKRSDHCLG